MTATAGTTRDVLEARVRFGGRLVSLLDTAGLTDSSDAVEVEGIARARDAVGRADLVLLVLDGSRTPTDGERALARDLEAQRGWVLLNKIDLASESYLASAAALRPGWRVLPISALTGEGFDDLEGGLREELDRFPASEPTPISSERQRDELTRVAETLEATLDHLDGSADELAAEELRSALGLLGRVVGSVNDEDVLDRIFAKFCIGK